ncbi:AbrB/MazE/SpoVT family DNA-binding domain-containing protein [Fusibacter tunisiensis]|uniref:Antitoxin MazE n=1 Tax=Fusibacter tunisiensis TaxID=1008308 RepID=A0ABS2MNA4_9FIRM|nr:AbrB/MazE/SpoVT family DNA-binding domain-containing protein [Fusibacter tunisiensis]MBM7560874.1 antitoxin MazE [Fusibacter tunisiensis]
MVTSIKKWGNSQGLRFSKEMLDAIGISVDDEVLIEVIDHKIIISKAKDNKVNLKKLFKSYEGVYKETEMNWGEPKGEEVW